MRTFWNGKRLTKIATMTFMGALLAGNLACSESEFSSSIQKVQKSSDDDSEAKDSEDATAGMFDQLGEVSGGENDRTAPEEGASDTAGGEAPKRSAKIDGLASVSDCSTAGSRGYLKEASLNVNFASNHGLRYQCSWAAKYDTKVGGIAEWKHTVSVPGDRVICKMDFESNGALIYDDAILLSLNEKILFTGSLGTGKIPFVDGFMMFHWPSIIGSRTDAPSRCAPGHTACTIPPTETVGTLKVAFNDDFNKKLMTDVESKGSAEFALRAFGDDDPKIDCRHAGLNVVVKYKYFEK